MAIRQQPAGTTFLGRVAIFVDGAHFEYIRRGARDFWGFSDEVDWRNILAEFSQDTFLLRAYYYAGEWTDDGIQEYVENLKRRGTPEPEVETELAGLKRLQYGQAGFRRYLSRIGFMVRTKPIKVFYTGRTKADLDLELAIDMLTLADRCDKFVLISGDSDFVPLVEAVGLKGVRVVVAATQQLPNPRAGDELLDKADEFVEIKDIWRRLERTKPRSPAPRDLAGKPFGADSR